MLGATAAARKPVGLRFAVCGFAPWEFPGVETVCGNYVQRLRLELHGIGRRAFLGFVDGAAGGRWDGVKLWKARLGRNVLDAKGFF